ncbi:MAG: hypothetical protein IH942_03105 [Acidobacteria bacterium]|nr:hypothetical protein [Acidobacteriota bacterium]
MIDHRRRAPEVNPTRPRHSSIQVTVDRYGRLMDSLDHQTAARLDAIAATVRVPGVMAAV